MIVYNAISKKHYLYISGRDSKVIKGQRKKLHRAFRAIAINGRSDERFAFGLCNELGEYTGRGFLQTYTNYDAVKRILSLDDAYLKSEFTVGGGLGWGARSEWAELIAKAIRYHKAYEIPPECLAMLNPTQLYPEVPSVSWQFLVDPIFRREYEKTHPMHFS